MNLQNIYDILQIHIKRYAKVMLIGVLKIYVDRCVDRRVDRSVDRYVERCVDRCVESYVDRCVKNIC
jgi:hypothetical protein